MATIYQSIEMLSKEKGIDPEIVLEAVKEAMLAAARKHYRTEGDLVAEFDAPSGAINIFAIKKVVAEVEDADREITLKQACGYDPAAAIDSEVRVPMDTRTLGRIAAQTAKQAILQKVREAERETVYAEYSDRVGDLVNCVIKRVEGMDLIVDMGKTEARLPKREQSRAENFTVADRIRCVIKSVEKAGKNAGVTVSRAAPELVMRLFEQEVPEIYDGTVVIEGCAREAGERTKIAVSSRDRDVDAVGACVGMKGMRVQSIIRELRGEKIDIIQYSEDPVVFATNALSPAKISRVTIIDSGEQHMEVIVDDSQLSLAIGRKGQNVRLGAKLLGWRIDIKSEEEKRQEVESEMAALVVPGAPVNVLLDHGLSEEMIGKLAAANIATVEQLGSMTPEQLELIPGIDPKMVEKIQSAVITYYSQFETAVEEQPAAPDDTLPTGESQVHTAGEATGAQGAELAAGPESLPIKAEPSDEGDDSASESERPVTETEPGVAGPGTGREETGGPTREPAIIAAGESGEHDETAPEIPDDSGSSESDTIKESDQTA